MKQLRVISIVLAIVFISTQAAHATNCKLPAVPKGGTLISNTYGTLGDEYEGFSIYAMIFNHSNQGTMELYKVVSQGYQKCPILKKVASWKVKDHGKAYRFSVGTMVKIRAFDDDNRVSVEFSDAYLNSFPCLYSYSFNMKKGEIVCDPNY